MTQSPIVVDEVKRICFRALRETLTDYINGTLHWDSMNRGHALRLLLGMRALRDDYEYAEMTG